MLRYVIVIWAIAIKLVRVSLFLRFTMVGDFLATQLEPLRTLPGTAAIWLLQGLKAKSIMEVLPPPAKVLNHMQIPPPSPLPTPFATQSSPPEILPPRPQRPTPLLTETQLPPRRIQHRHVPSKSKQKVLLISQVLSIIAEASVDSCCHRWLPCPLTNRVRTK